MSSHLPPRVGGRRSGIEVCGAGAVQARYDADARAFGTGAAWPPGGVLLGVALSGLPVLCVKRCCRVELLLDARLSPHPLLALLDLRGGAGGGRNCRLTETAGGKCQTPYERKN